MLFPKKKKNAFSSSTFLFLPCEKFPNSIYIHYIHDPPKPRPSFSLDLCTLRLNRLYRITLITLPILIQLQIWSRKPLLMRIRLPLSICVMMNPARLCRQYRVPITECRWLSGGGAENFGQEAFEKGLERG